MIERGAIYWVDLGPPRRSRPGKRRPVLVVQADSYSASRLANVVGVAITSNTLLAALPGNVFVPASASGLPKDCVANVTAMVTVDKTDLGDPAGVLPGYLTDDVDRSLRRVLGL